MNVVRDGERDQGGEVGGMNIQTGGREGLREKDSREDSRNRFFSVPSWSLHLLRRPRFLQLEEPFLSPPLRPAGVSCFLLCKNKPKIGKESVAVDRCESFTLVLFVLVLRFLSGSISLKTYT